MERNQVDKSDDLILWVIENLERIEMSPRNWIRQEWIFARLAKYCIDRQDLANAKIYYKKAMEGFHSNRQVVHYLLYQLIDLNVEIWLAMGQLNSRKFNIEEQVAFLDPIGKAAPAKNTALVLYYLGLNEIEKASSILQETIPQLETLGMKERLLEALILRSLVYQACNDYQESMKSLHQALQIAVSEGYIRVFTNKGKAMKSLLKRYYRQVQNGDIKLDESLENLVKEIILELQQKESPASVSSLVATRSPADLAKPVLGPLTSRELEVVKLIAKGTSTKEIATTLTISLYTTKSHIKSAYRKLEVHSRSELRQRMLDLSLI
jgi:LuxR family maltose regulon positive regulatory protein